MHKKCEAKETILNIVQISINQLVKIVHKIVSLVLSAINPSFNFKVTWHPRLNTFYLN